MKKVSPLRNFVEKHYERAVKRLVLISPQINLSSKKLKDSFECIAKHANNVDQRAVIGVTSILTQPFIDLKNKHVDEDTKLTSFARTLSKLTVGTCVGIVVRQLCMNFFAKYKIQNDKQLLAKSMKNLAILKKYNNRLTFITALGTILGIIVSIITNILIDAPLTQLSTNFLYKKLKTSEKGGK